MKLIQPMKFIVFILLTFSINLAFSQIITVELPEHGDAKMAELFQKRVAMPIYRVKRNKYYSEIPHRYFRNNQFSDTISLLIKKAKGDSDYYPRKVRCLNKKKWKFTYDRKQYLITIKEGELRVKYYLYDLTQRDGKIQNHDIINDKTIVDTCEWYGVEREYVKYGFVIVEDKKYSIAIADKSLDGYFDHDWDVISIDTASSRFHYVNFNARCQKIKNTRYLDFEGAYYKIKKIDRKGNFLEMERCDSIVQDSCIYIDNQIRNFSFQFKDSTYSLHSFLNGGKYLLLDIWTEFCPPCISDIPLLNELQKKYEEKVTILGLFNGKLEDLERIIKDYNIETQQGIVTKEIKGNVLQNGYPNKVLISPTGEILRYKIRKKTELESILKAL